jgi:hypothetical protein
LLATTATSVLRLLHCCLHAYTVLCNSCNITCNVTHNYITNPETYCTSWTFRRCIELSAFLIIITFCSSQNLRVHHPLLMYSASSLLSLTSLRTHSLLTAAKSSVTVSADVFTVSDGAVGSCHSSAVTAVRRPNTSALTVTELLAAVGFQGFEGSTREGFVVEGLGGAPLGMSRR